MTGPDHLNIRAPAITACGTPIKDDFKLNARSALEWTRYLTTIKSVSQLLPAYVNETYV